MKAAFDGSVAMQGSRGLEELARRGLAQLHAMVLTGHGRGHASDQGPEPGLEEAAAAVAVAAGRGAELPVGSAGKGHWSCVVRPQDPCPLCGLPLGHDDHLAASLAESEARLGLPRPLGGGGGGGVRIFRCGHGFHRECVVDDACVCCQAQAPWVLTASRG